MTMMDWTCAPAPWNRLGPEIAEHLQWVAKLTESECKELAYRIEQFWHRRGQRNITVQAVPVKLDVPKATGGRPFATFWEVKSNLTGAEPCERLELKNPYALHRLMKK